jgi:hypothetical protein
MFGTVQLSIVGLAAFLAGAGIFYTFGHWNGEDFGREAERAAALQKSMDLIRERSETNAEIGDLDDAGLCAALDGHWVPDTQRCE